MMRSTGRSGYTMIEVVVVMLVMGILAAVAAPRYRSSTVRFRVEAAASRLVADINYARGRAMTKGTATEGWISFFPDSEEYLLTATPSLDHPDKEYRVDFTKTAYPVDMVSAVLTNTSGFNGNDIVKFDMYGSPWIDSAPLTSGQIILTSGSEIRTVIIDPVTGKASVL